MPSIHWVAHQLDTYLLLPKRAVLVCTLEDGWDGELRLLYLTAKHVLSGFQKIYRTAVGSIPTTMQGAASISTAIADTKW